MDEFHSGLIKNSQKNLILNNTSSSLIITNNARGKEKNKIHPNPIYIYDAPNGLGLSILQVIFQIAINPLHSSNIYSAYILPDNLNRIFFEASDLKSVRKILNFISGISSVPKYLPVVRGDQIFQYFINPVNCLHFHPGQIVTIHNPEFNNQSGQVVDLKKDSGKILVKTYPHIDYEFLRTHKNFTLQSQVNSAMDAKYQAPMVPFQKEGLITKISSLPIWNSQVNVIKWDNKCFIGKFQYLLFSYKELTHKRLSQMTLDERKAFEEGISEYEKTNPSFLKGFCEQLDFEGTHDSESILSLSLNKGTPSWARKHDHESNHPNSEKLADPENNSSKSQNKIHFLEKYASSPTNQIENDQPSQSNNDSTSRSLYNMSDDNDSFQPLPDFDDEINDEIENSKENENENKISKSKSPIYIGSSSSQSSENEDKNEKKAKPKRKDDKNKNKKSSTNNIIENILRSSSSDSDIDALFNFPRSQKKSNNDSKKSKSSKKSKKSSSNPPSQKNANENQKSRSNAKPEEDTVNLNYLNNLFSSDNYSDSNSEDGTDNNKKTQSFLAAQKIFSSTSSDNENNNDSNKESQRKKKSKKDSEKEVNKKKSKKEMATKEKNTNNDSHKKAKSKIKEKPQIEMESDSSSDVVEIEPSPKKSPKNKKKDKNKPIIDKLMQESVDFGDSPPSEKTFFKYVSGSDDDDNESNGVQFEPTIDKEQIIEEQSQQVSKKKTRQYYKSHGLPVPVEYEYDSYDIDSEDSDSSTSSSY